MFVILSVAKNLVSMKHMLASDPLAFDVSFDQYMMHVRLLDGREISTPLEWFPKLCDAKEKQRKKWRLIGNGVGIHWEDIDEDISVAALLRG